MTWVLMTAIGVAAMWATRRVRNRTIDFILVRLAGGAFMAAGLLGVGGVLGRWVETGIATAISVADQLGAATLGSAIAWIIATGLGALWVAAMLPDSWFRFDPPDWLVWSGIIAPSLLASVPGPVGSVLRQITHAAGQAVGAMTSAMFGM